MVPKVPLPPVSPFTLQVTAVFGVPVTVAVNWTEEPAGSTGAPGMIETVTDDSGTTVTIAQAVAEGSATLVAHTLSGPTGGTADKPIGLVHLAIASRHGVDARRLLLRGDRGQIRLQAAFGALDLLRETLARTSPSHLP